MKQRLAILGSTGSIGVQTLDIARENPGRFEVRVLTANRNWERLARQAREFDADAAVIADKQHYAQLRDALAGTDTKVYAGEEAVAQVAAGGGTDVVVNALVGYAGLAPTVAAIEAGKKLALANKESLVVGGACVIPLARKRKAPVIPIDSEHSAIFQCLVGERAPVRRLIVTCSGGAFRDFRAEELANVTVEQALRGLMIPSGNDAAIVLAEYVGKKIDPKTKDAEATFVKAMNERAKKLGCTGTLFENPHGLDFDEWAGDMHSTAHDVALMMQEAMKNDTIREVVASEDSWIEVTGADGTDHSHSMDTHNYLLGQDGNIGGKTGTTDDAGYCFTSAYNRDGDEIYTVILNSTTTDQRFTDTATLANWYYGHKVTVAIANTQEKTANGNPLMARIGQTDWTDKTIDATLADPTAQATVFSLAGEVTEKVSYDDLSGTVHVGDKAGSVTLKQDGTKIAVMDLVADEEGAGPNPIEWLLVKLDRLGRRIDNRPLTAESETVAKAPEM